MVHFRLSRIQSRPFPRCNNFFLCQGPMHVIIVEKPGGNEICMFYFMASQLFIFYSIPQLTSFCLFTNIHMVNIRKHCNLPTGRHWIDQLKAPLYSLYLFCFSWFLSVTLTPAMSQVNDGRFLLFCLACLESVFRWGLNMQILLKLCPGHTAGAIVYAYRRFI